MPKRVYNNVEDHRLLDGKKVVEDVTSVTLPTISQSTTTIDASGMVAAVDVPSMFHLEAMEFSVAHNNGVNCNDLSLPGKHTIEVRVARQVYGVNKGEMSWEGMKVRVTGLYKSNEKGSIEKGNPYGNTVKFSVLRYEEIIDGKQIVLVDAMTGQVVYNEKSFTSEVEKLLN